MEAPRTVDEVYQNFAMRRQGLVKALTDGTPRRRERATNMRRMRDTLERDRARLARRRDRSTRSARRAVTEG
jgi:hypothetical protein